MIKLIDYFLVFFDFFLRQKTSGRVLNELVSNFFSSCLLRKMCNFFLQSKEGGVFRSQRRFKKTCFLHTDVCRVYCKNLCSPLKWFRRQKPQPPENQIQKKDAGFIAQAHFDWSPELAFFCFRFSGGWGSDLEFHGICALIPASS